MFTEYIAIYFPYLPTFIHNETEKVRIYKVSLNKTSKEESYFLMIIDLPNLPKSLIDDTLTGSDA